MKRTVNLVLATVFIALTSGSAFSAARLRAKLLAAVASEEAAAASVKALLDGVMAWSDAPTALAVFQRVNDLLSAADAALDKNAKAREHVIALVEKVCGLARDLVRAGTMEKSAYDAFCDTILTKITAPITKGLLSVTIEAQKELGAVADTVGAIIAYKAADIDPMAAQIADAIREYKAEKERLAASRDEYESTALTVARTYQARLDAVRKAKLALTSGGSLDAARVVAPTDELDDLLA